MISKIIFYYDTPKSDPQAVKAKNINSYLADGPDVYIKSQTIPLSMDVPEMKYGSMPIDNGNLILSKEQMEELLADEPEAKTTYDSIWVGTNSLTALSVTVFGYLIVHPAFFAK